MNIHICCRTNLAKDIMLFHKAADRMIQNAKLNGPATLIDGSSQTSTCCQMENRNHHIKFVGHKLFCKEPTHIPFVGLRGIQLCVEQYQLWFKMKKRYNFRQNEALIDTVDGRCVFHTGVTVQNPHPEYFNPRCMFCEVLACPMTVLTGYTVQLCRNFCGYRCITLFGVLYELFVKQTRYALYTEAYRNM